MFFNSRSRRLIKKAYSVIVLSTILWNSIPFGFLSSIGVNAQAGENEQGTIASEEATGQSTTLAVSEDSVNYANGENKEGASSGIMLDETAVEEVDDAALEDTTGEKTAVEEPTAEEPVIEEPEVIAPEIIGPRCVTDDTFVASSVSDWEVNHIKDWAQTIGPVKLGVTYYFPQDPSVSIRFTCLPAENEITPLKIQRIRTSELNLPAGVSAATDYAYDFTTGMTNGTFTYDLTLPKPLGVEDAELSYIEKSVEELAWQGNWLNEVDFKKVDPSTVEVAGEEITAKGMDHFTIVIVTSPGPTFRTTMVNGMPYVSVPPSTNVTVSVTVSGVKNDKWYSTGYKIGNGAWQCANTTDQNWNSTRDYSDDFNITAPATVGSYDLSLQAYGNNGCTGTASSEVVLNNVIRVVTTPPSLTPPSLVSNPSDPVALTSVTGKWTSITGGSGHQGVGTSEIRWGTPSGSQKSGLRFTNSGNQSFDTGNTFYLGMLTHMNWPTQPGTAANKAKLQITLNFDRPNIPDVVLNYDFDIEETPNTSGSCKVYQRTLTPCDDKVTFPNPYAEETFTIGDVQYTLVIDGFVDAYPSGNPVSEFVTEEKKDNSAFLVGHLSSVLVQRPEIRLTKKTNDQDIASAPGENLYIGDTVTWKYIIQNSGNVELTDVAVTDDPAVDIDCDPHTAGNQNSGFTLAPGATLTCTASGIVTEGQYHNVATVIGTPSAGSSVTAQDESWYYGIWKKAHIIVQKTTIPSGDQTVFTIHLTDINGNNLSDGTISDSKDQTFDVDAGTYKIVEDVPGGWGATSNPCLNGITVSAGQTKYCEIVNKKLPILTVKKVIVGDSVPYSNFSFKVDGGTVIPFEIDGDNQLYVVPDQAYSITEVNPGSSYNVSYSDGCNGTLTYNQTATCTITNTKYGSITIVKDADPNSSQPFGFTTSGDGLSPFALSDDGVSGHSNSQTFNNLLPGNYSVTETGEAGWDLTGLVCNDPDNGSTVNLNTANIDLDAGETITCTFTNTMRGAIGGHKYDDADGNVSTTGDRTGIANWTIELWQNGIKINETTTTPDGTYGFSNLVPGEYKLKEVLKDNWYPLYPDSGSDGFITVTLNPGGQLFNNNFVNTQGASVTIYKDVDTDGDGDIDITHSTDWFWNRDGSGHYSTGGVISRLQPGTYTFSEEQKIGYHVTSLVCNNGVTNPNHNYGAVESQSITLSSGQNLICTFTNTRDTGKLEVIKTIDDGTALTQWSFKLNDGNWISADADGKVDFGQVPTLTNHTIYEQGPDGYHLSSVSCTKSYTDNQNGSVTTTVDKGGTTVCTFNNNVDKGTITIVKVADPKDSQDFGFTTTGTGLNNFSLDDDTDDTLPNTITFSNLYPRAYSVKENSVGGWDLTDLSCVESGGQSVNNSTVDINNREAILRLEPGENITCTFTNTKRGSISVHKFVDRNANGTKDENEYAYKSGLKMELFSSNDCSGSVKGSGNTDGSGNITFSNLAPGVYSVKETVPSTYKNSTPVCQSVVVGAGENKQLNFGNYRLGKVIGFKCNDLNGNGSCDIGEPTMEGWTFNLVGPNGYNQSQVTDATGVEFSGLEYGTYTVSEVMQDGWVETVPPLGKDRTFTINDSLYSEVYFDFTNFKYGSISGQKFNDLNGNGVKDANEPGLSGWTIELDKDADGSVDSTTVTDVSGNYTFTGLTYGTYRIREQGQAGWIQTTANPADKLIQSGTNVTGVDFGNRQTGAIKITKIVVPEDESVWTFTLQDYSSGGEVTYSGLGHNESYTFSNLIPGTYEIYEETDPNYFTTVQCGGSGPWDQNGFLTTVVAGQTLECTFTNTKYNPQLNVVKTSTTTEITGAGQVVPYTFTVSNAGNQTLTGITVTDPKCDAAPAYQSGDANSDSKLQTTEIWVYTCNHTVTQDEIDAVNGNGNLHNVVTVTSNESGSASDDHDISIRAGKITIKKNTVPAGAEDSFEFEPNWGEGNFNLSDGQDYGSGWMQTGSYSIREIVPEGWELTSLVCVDPDQGSDIAFDTATAYIDLDAGKTITCTFTNSKLPTLTLVKEVINDNGGTAVAKHFQAKIDGKDVNWEEPQKLSIGEHTISESVLSGYNALGWDCSEDGKITLNAGENMTCTITNDDYARIIVHKEVLDESGEPSAIDVLFDVTLSSYVEEEGDDEKNDEGDQSTSGLLSAYFFWQNNNEPKIMATGQISDPVTGEPVVAEFPVPSGEYTIHEAPNKYFSFEGCRLMFEERQPVSILPNPEYPLIRMKNSTDDVHVICTNRMKPPTLSIEKTNNWLDPDLNWTINPESERPVLYAGGSVVYQICVTASGNDVENVIVGDVLPAGFIYHSGLSSVRGVTTIGEPVYDSNGYGKWNLGDMEEGEKITLRFIADISSVQEPGLYPDIAWTQGKWIKLTSEEKMNIFGNATEGIFVGTEVKVVAKAVEATGVVLGAQTELIKTGQNILAYVVGAIALLVTGLIAWLITKRKKNDGGKMKIAAMTVCAMLLVGSSFLGLARKVTAVEMVNVKVEQPQSPMTTNSFNIGFSAAYVSDDPSSVALPYECQYRKSEDLSFVKFDGGDGMSPAFSAVCPVIPSKVLLTDGTYVFRVMVNGKPSNEVMVTIDMTKPSPVLNYVKTKVGDCQYKISFTTADDSQTTRVEIYRGKTESFPVNAASLVTSMPVMPGMSYEHTDTNCDTPAYYVVRAFDSAGNHSTDVGDIIVTTQAVVVPGAGGAGGAGGIGGAVEGAGTEEKTEGEKEEGKGDKKDEKNESGEVLGEKEEDSDGNGIPGGNEEREKGGINWGTMIKVGAALIGISALVGVFVMYRKKPQ